MTIAYSSHSLARWIAAARTVSFTRLCSTDRSSDTPCNTWPEKRHTGRPCVDRRYSGTGFAICCRRRRRRIVVRSAAATMRVPRLPENRAAGALPNGSPRRFGVESRLTHGTSPAFAGRVRRFPSGRPALPGGEATRCEEVFRRARRADRRRGVFLPHASRKGPVRRAHASSR